MTEQAISTTDKGEAMVLLEKCLESKELLDVRIQNLDGVISVEILKPTDDPEAEC
jgi:hypothetical protein